MKRLDKTDGAIAIVVFGAAIVSGVAIWETTRDSARLLTLQDLFVLLAMFVLVVGLDFVQVVVPRFKFKAAFSVSCTVYVAATIGFNAFIGIALALMGSFLTEAFAHRETRKLIFNVAQHVLMTGAAGIFYGLIAGRTVGVPLATSRTVIAAILASILYLFLNNTLFSFVVGIDIGESPVKVFLASAPGLLLQNITLPSVGLLLTTIRDLSPLSLLVVMLPLLGPYLAMRGYRDNLEQMGLTIEALADSVDRRDPTTARHSERVAAYTKSLIDEMGNIKFAEAEAIISAARVHDVGKVGIPDLILLKPGPLTEAEFAVIRTHAVEGFNILRDLPMYKAGLGVVRNHHERYAGGGYPDDISGEAIPLGARIVAVADAYDVMTTDRPYARARSQREACAELVRGKGTHFDPIIVDAFVAMINRPAMLEASASQRAPMPSPS